MKKIIFLLLFPAVIFISCKSNNSKELIVNKWKITDITAPNMSVPDSIKKALMQGILEFTKDGKFTQHFKRQSFTLPKPSIHQRR